MRQALYGGIDVGSAYTKVVVLDSKGEILGFGIRRSGVDFARTGQECLLDTLAEVGLSLEQLKLTAATGYGRKNLIQADLTRSELSCHARGCYHYFPGAIHIIDIGGQDNKIIAVNQQGTMIDFKMNRKCAAGTGAFLEEMANRLEIALTDFDGLARQSVDRVKLNSFCTVFAGTEILECIRAGRSLPDIAKGVYYSILKRIKEMAPLKGKTVMTGGLIEHHPFLVEMAIELFDRPIRVAPRPQLTGALGAALYALERDQSVECTGKPSTAERIPTTIDRRVCKKADEKQVCQSRTP